MITHDTVWSSIVKENSRYEEISVTLKTKDGTTVLALSNDAIGEGSFIFDCQCVNDTDIEPGAVYAGEVAFTLKASAGLTDTQNANLVGGSINATITVSDDAGQTSSIPVGIYYIKSAKRLDGTDGDRAIVAYDIMDRTRKTIPSTIRGAAPSYAPFAFLTWCCTQCSTTKRPLSLLNTQAEIESMPNGTLTYTLSKTADVTTYSDLIAELGKVMGCFATIDRSSNSLVMKQFTNYDNSQVRTLTEDLCFGEKAEEYMCSFGKIRLGSGEYPTTDDDDVSGLVLTMTASALSCAGTESTLAQALYTPYSDISYRPCSIEYNSDPALEVGDWIVVTNTAADGTVTGYRALITHVSWTLLGSGRLESTGSFGGDSKQVGSAASDGTSGTDKSITNLENRVSTLENGSDSGYYLSVIAFNTAGFAVTYTDGTDSTTNQMNVTEDSSGNITKITNTSTGTSITVTY